MKRMKKGDVVRCHGLDEMLQMDRFLAKEGYVTDYQFRWNGEKVYWIVIDEDEHEKKK